MTKQLIKPDWHPNGRGKSFADQNLSFHDLRNADLRGANFYKTDLTSSNLSKAKFTRLWCCREHFEIASFKSSIMVDATIKNTIVGGANLSKADLTNANISYSSFTEAHGDSDIKGANLSGAVMVNVIAKNSDFRKANLTGANLNGADLSNASFACKQTGDSWFGAVCNDPILGWSKSRSSPSSLDTNLSKIKSGNIKGNPQSLPSGWILREGFLIGHNADLSGEDLTNKNFENINFRASNLSSADLKRADLTNAVLTNAVLTNAKTASIIGSPKALPEGWVQRDQSLIGPYANLNNANLEQADLSKANFLKDAFKLKGLSKPDYNNGLLSEAENNEAQEIKATHQDYKLVGNDF